MIYGRRRLYVRTVHAAFAKKPSVFLLRRTAAAPKFYCVPLLTRLLTANLAAFLRLNKKVLRKKNADLAKREGKDREEEEERVEELLSCSSLLFRPHCCCTLLATRSHVLLGWAGSSGRKRVGGVSKPGPLWIEADRRTEEGVGGKSSFPWDKNTGNRTMSKEMEFRNEMEKKERNTLRKRQSLYSVPLGNADFP